MLPPDGVFTVQRCVCSAARIQGRALCPLMRCATKLNTATDDMNSTRL